tara:strand:- start:26 stop:271 length:246 start_codon:yes stop_codon:yes gene_type:complete
MKQSREKAEQKLRDIYGQAFGFTIQLTETHKVFGDLGTLFTIEIPDILLNQMKWKTGDYLNISIKDNQIVIRRPSALEIFK